MGLDLAGSYASDPSAGTHIVLTQLAGQDNKGWVTLGPGRRRRRAVHAGRSRQGVARRRAA